MTFFSHRRLFTVSALTFYTSSSSSSLTKGPMPVGARCRSRYSTPFLFTFYTGQSYISYCLNTLYRSVLYFLLFKHFIPLNTSYISTPTYCFRVSTPYFLLSTHTPFISSLFLLNS